MASGKRPKTPLPPKIGRYQVICALGEGGMGSVCLTRVLGPGGFERLVAVKLLHDHLSRREGFVKMFLDEARIAARIRHPNVVPVLEVGDDDGRHFIAMDYVSGETLARALNRLHKHGRRLPYGLAAHLVWAASEGLHAAHELRDATGALLNVVHRDVSPENLIVGYDGAVRITDFGIAKANDQSSFTMPGTWKGKAGYLSPEQIQSQPVDRRADVFSLGIVLWECTLGRPLFKSDNPFTSAEKIREGRIPLPHSIEADYPPELEAIVMRALSTDPSVRFQTARSFGDELRRFLATLPQLIGPVEVEQFMANLFADRLQKRRDLEHRAAIAPSIPPPRDPMGTQEAQQLTVPVEPLLAASLLEGQAGEEWPLLGSIPLLTPDFSNYSSARSRSSQSGGRVSLSGSIPGDSDRPLLRAPSPLPIPSPTEERMGPPPGLEEDPLLSAMTAAEIQAAASPVPDELRAHPSSPWIDVAPPVDRPDASGAGHGLWLFLLLLLVAVAAGTYFAATRSEQAAVGAGGGTSTAAAYRRFEAASKSASQPPAPPGAQPAPSPDAGSASKKKARP